MIVTDRTITVRKGVSNIDDPVIVYRGDYEVAIRFTIMNSKFKFMSGVNMIETEKASYGQLAILTPYGGNVFSDMVRCSEGTVAFVMTKELMDQIEEVGLYSFQIRLFDGNRESRISIPPVEFGIEIREPVASEDHDNKVNNAIVGYSIAKVVDPSEENVGPTFDESGAYNKTDWKTGDRISQGKLNKIEDAIYQINQNEVNDRNAISKQMSMNFIVLQNEINNLVLESGESDMEVVQARGEEATLNDRLNKMDDAIIEVNTMIQNGITELEMDLTNGMSELETDVAVKLNIATKKAELLDTFVCNNVFYKLKNHANYPILQGGCVSDDGTYYYCCSVTNSSNQRGVIDKYSVGSMSDFATWSHVKTSSELDTGHGNDMTYFNNEIYLIDGGTNSNRVMVINPETLTISRTIQLTHGATAISFNKKLNMFVTRRKNEWGVIDFYDTDLNFVKTNETNAVTFDTVQGIDSDDSYIYYPCSDTNFGNSIVAFDLNGNFIKRLGSNTISEIEHIVNFNGYFIAGFYKNGNNFVGIATVRTDKRMTASRYVLNQGRNTVLSDSTVIFNGDIQLNTSRKYYTHLSFNITVDGVDVETKILDITDTQETTSRILNTFRLTSSGQAIFYRSLLTIRDTSLNITPVAFHIMNVDGSRVVKTYDKNTSDFKIGTCIGISNVCGQILCGQRINE